MAERPLLDTAPLSLSGCSKNGTEAGTVVSVEPPLANRLLLGVAPAQDLYLGLAGAFPFQLGGTTGIDRGRGTAVVPSPVSGTTNRRRRPCLRGLDGGHWPR